MTLAVAHRGNPVEERENTLASFASAVSAGADMVEVDLHRTRDGTIVVIHDETLERLWGVPRRVDQLDWAAISAIEQAGLRIPSLAQVLASVRSALMVDFTGPDVVDGALGEVLAADALDRCLFVTGHVDALRRLRARAPRARIGLTWLPEEPPPWSLLASLGAEFWNPFWARAGPAVVEAMHAHGYSVSVWTVDDPADMAAMVAAGVDAITTNRIADLRRTLDGGDEGAGERES